MLNKYKYILLTLIVFFAFVVRFYNISSVPPGLNWDEAALGYNAYSLGIDGRDEFGKILPYQFLESFGDYKPVVYSYLSIIPIKVFGLNELGIRFTSAFLGTLTVLVTFFLVKEIFNKKNDEFYLKIALVSSILLAISPWHIMLSRGAYEANVSTFFVVLGIYFFLKAINVNFWFLVLAALSFVVPIYTFNSPRVFLPIFVFMLAIVFRKKLLAHKKQAIISFLIGLILILPILPFLFSPQAKIRFNEVNIFSDPEIVKVSNQKIFNDDNSYLSKIINNRRVMYGTEFTKHYFDNLSPSFLFIKGDGNPRFSIQDVGQMYLIELLFLLVGLVMLFRLRPGHYWIIPVWLILGIIPAATARETPHALRIENVLPTFQIITGFGIVFVLDKAGRYKKIIGGLIVFAYLISFAYFYNGLFKHYSRHYSAEWQFSYKELVPYLEDVQSNYNKIIVTDKLGRPYVFFLIYGGYSPNYFRNNSFIERETLGFVNVRKLGKYEFKREILNSQLEYNVLYIERPEDLPDEGTIVRIKTFKLLNGNEDLVAYVKK